ncbi:Cytochrome B pre-mRNA-processing protein 6 [Wickerhamomyces ciferrii]|uniref:Cytochrome B pre-mRNA-processing protein 6 n=1 Tax=Wickerhamomyces ciferrii (strain ATCC 14091 / BCRC 22168 / CBS 111 / JCM 3599 / NBRC 0793 / NRRL Y-1031 F-60-10) TaxID=1206466 RepID=K0KT87_WICCF|nr:Cytochrome B pre-mRNA-processing protein 6 [Wickerhamomyces ciferrii]CCH45242.1 Cytochrome B pre-mRNA-processing protein 6 [Wickerhamomyces ciferrii]
MSVKEAAKTLVKLLDAVPKERLTTLSLKEVQLYRYRPLAGLKNPENNQKASISDIVAKVNPYSIKEPQLTKEEHVTEEDILQQIKSLKSINSNQYRDYYNPGDKLLKPKGHPEYYERLLAEINGESKENLITGMRTVMLGK